MDARQKNYRRLFRSCSELREIILAAYRGRNEVLRAALSLQAYEALQVGLEEIVTARRQQIKKGPSASTAPANTSSNNNASVTPQKTLREASLRAFLSNSWVQGFHDVEMQDDLIIPEMVANGQVYKNRTASYCGRKAIEELNEESLWIVDEYNRALDAPFDAYCEDQRQWAETVAVTDLEYKGDLAVKRLGHAHRMDILETAKLNTLRAEASLSRWDAVARMVASFWCSYEQEHCPKNWKLSKYPDRLHRRILFVPNRNFHSHQDAAYEGMLGERSKSCQVELEKEQEEYTDLMSRAKTGIVRYNPDTLTEENDAGYDSEHIYNNSHTDLETLTETVADSDDDSLPTGMDGIDMMDTNEDSGWTQVHSDDAKQTQPEQIEDASAWAKEFQWAYDEKSLQTFDVLLVSLVTVTEGELLLTTHSLYFHPTANPINNMTKEKVESTNIHDETQTMCWRLSKLTEVHGRRYMLRAQALELFFADAIELFINFNQGPAMRDRFFSRLRTCKVPMLNHRKSLNPRVVFKKSKVTELWRKRKISNFQYIMQLNIMAGRTFNDITQYPVFPWILADYTSQTLDLNNPRSYRDLAKPVGALNTNRLAQLIERYNNLDGFPDEEKFLYGSHYSSPGVVLHYLVRQEPFTTMAIGLQSGRFDCPDRLFFDMAGCWKSCLTSTSDVKELIPEFFTCPEIFLNTSNLPLGETQNKIKLGDVKLPPWANNSAYEFVRIHRLALESDYVSQHLNHWVDLIFGYKQRGDEAVAAYNLFHHLSYEGSVDLDRITDDVDRNATESHIQNFGQTPSQLIVKEPHPVRMTEEECWTPLCYKVSRLPELRCHTPRKQFGGGDNAEAGGAIISIHVLTETIVVIYSDLSIGTYKWSPTRSMNSPFFFKADKLRQLGSRSLSVSSTVACDFSPDTLTKSSKRNIEQMMKQKDLNKLAVGHSSFGVTLGGSVKESLSRRAAVGATRAIESTSANSSNMDAASLLLSCGYWDNTIKVHTVDGLRLKCSENGGHRGPINCLSIGDDGGLMITGGQDCTCRVWVVHDSDMAAALSSSKTSTTVEHTSASNVKEKERLLTCCHVLYGHEAPVSCIAFSSVLDIKLSGSVDGVIVAHSVRRAKFIRAIHVWDNNTDRDSNTTGNDSCSDYAEYKGQKVLQKGNSSSSCANRSFSRGRAAVRKLVLDNSGIFVAHLEDGMLQMFTINGVRLCTADAGEKLNAMDICPGGEMLVTGGENCHVVIRTLHDLAVRCVLDLSSHGPIRCISFTPPEMNPAPQFMYIGTDDGRLTVVDRDLQQTFEEEYVDGGLPMWRVHDGATEEKLSSNTWWTR